VRIDLHTHSTASDGTQSPAEVMTSAREAGLDVIALTDHDTIKGWDDAADAAEGLEFVPGAEMSCQTADGVSLHMLGLLFDRTNAPLIDAMEITRDDRMPRMERMVANLAADGLAISMEQVWAQVPDGATLGRPHLADALVAAGIVNTRDEAFVDLLHNDSKYYVGHLAPTPEEAVRLIKAAGGVAIFAHPGASKRGEIVSDEEIAALSRVGLDALEVDHRDHDAQTRAHLRELAEQLGLLCTGASDYHGTGKLNQLGENVTDPQVWEVLRGRGVRWKA
jgi:3',5'-nucleoside bisphosphate phosphatase